MTYIYVKAKRSFSAHDGYIRLDRCSFSQRELFRFSHLLYSRTCYLVYSRTSSNYNRSRREKQRDAKLITHYNSDNENLIPHLTGEAILIPYLLYQYSKVKYLYGLVLGLNGWVIRAADNYGYYVIIQLLMRLTDD